MRRLRRGLWHLWQWDVCRARPAALIHYRYFLPKQTPAIRLRRRLWLDSRYRLPFLFWLPLELLRWLFWLCWQAPKRCSAALAAHGDAVATRTGVSVFEQEKALRYWARHWCVSPHEVYVWQLYQPHVDGLAIIYARETQAFHRLQNKKYPQSTAELQLLSDKIGLANYLAPLALPMVQTLKIAPDSWQKLLQCVMQYGAVFCKSRHGSRGLGAFSLWLEGDALRGQTFAGEVLAQTRACQQAWQSLYAQGEVLIQPLLHNHPDIQTVVDAPAAITVRVVSIMQGGRAQLLCASLEVPEDAGRAIDARGYRIFPIDLESGQCQLLSALYLAEASIRQQYQAMLDRMPNQGVLPFWNELTQASLQAQQALSHVWAIAWDWVMTPSGPVLLEGNGGWGLTIPQMQVGGFARLAITPVDCN
jgi:hypothetical protein